MEKRVGFLFVCMIILSTFSSANIILKEPEDLYNLGDKLYVSADGLIGSDTGNLNFNLVCDNFTVNLAKVSARAFSQEGDSWGIPYKYLTKEDLEIENISSIIGSCQVIATLGENMAATKMFLITNDVYLNGNLDKSEYKPGEGITVSANIVKANGDLFNGFIEGSANFSSFSKAVEDGEVIEIFSVPDTAESGNYVLNLKAYDSTNGETQNEGNLELFFKIKQVPTSILLGISSEEVLPGDKITIGPEIYDQSGKEMPGLITVEVANPNGEIKTYTVESKQFLDIDLEKNATSGEWIVATYFGDLLEEKVFRVLELQEVSFEFNEDILTITNVGNTKYNKTIEVNIGEEKVELELNIDVGESRKFDLNAPQGEYDISVGDGVVSASHSVLLTGKTISINDIKNGNIFKSYTLVWIFLIFVLGATAIILLRKYNKKTKTLGKEGKVEAFFKFLKEKLKGRVPSKMKSGISNSLNFTNKSPEVHSFDESYSHEDKTLIDLTKKKMSSAESTLVLKGEKLSSAVVAISLKNYEGLNDNSKRTINGLVEKVRDMKGLVDWKEDHMLVVFSPLVTKTYNNESLAVKAGLLIFEKLNEHNKRFNNKIEFNIGIHCGELIASKQGEKLKYTSIGNTVSLPRRISESDKEMLLVSEEIRKKLLRDLKVEKHKMIGEHQIYSVKDIRNKEANEAKLKELLKRM